MLRQGGGADPLAVAVLKLSIKPLPVIKICSLFCRIIIHNPVAYTYTRIMSV